MINMYNNGNWFENDKNQKVLKIEMIILGFTAKSN